MSCCEEMKRFLGCPGIDANWSFDASKQETPGAFGVHVSEDDSWEEFSFRLCPWCATPLREDGELKVGPQGGAETSRPREKGDTLAGGEG